jgi:hypothetical protein
MERHLVSLCCQTAKFWSRQCDRRNGSPILVTLVSFWHFAVVRQQILTPAIAFTSVRYHYPCCSSFLTDGAILDIWLVLLLHRLYTPP